GARCRNQCRRACLRRCYDRARADRAEGRMMRYTIRMKNCAFFARHGLFDEEERLGQRFYVDAELEVEPGPGLEGDVMDSTVDYGTAFIEIERIVTGKRRFLIEALAFDVARALCEKFPRIARA